MTQSGKRYLSRVALALLSVGIIGLVPVAGCLSNPTPHPGQEPGHPTTGEGADANEDNGVGGLDGDNASAGPPCAPGDGDDAFVGDAGDAGGDAVAGDADVGDVGPVDGGGVIGWAVDCGPAEPSEGDDGGDAGPGAAMEGR